MSRLLRMMCMTDEVTNESEKAYPLTITANSNRYLNDYQLYGNTVQEGSPSPDAPDEVLSVGDLVTEGDYAGKYKIPVTVTSGDTTKTTDIYLDAPLRKIGGYADYIDFKNRRVVRRVGELVLTGTEILNLQTNFELENTYLFILSNVVTNRHTEGSWGANRDLCNHLKRSTNSIQSSGTDAECFAFNSAVASKNTLYLRLNKSRLAEGTRQAVQAWLKELYNNGTPMKFYYMLEESVDEAVNLPKLLQFKGESTYMVETSISPSGLQVKYY